MTLYDTVTLERTSKFRTCYDPTAVSCANYWCIASKSCSIGSLKRLGDPIYVSLVRLSLYTPRSIGAQIERTTNHEAMRDLSGRRQRDINNERRLQDYVAKQVTYVMLVPLEWFHLSESTVHQCCEVLSFLIGSGRLHLV